MQLAEVEPEWMQGTNLQHALMLAARHLRRHPDAEPVVLVVTDGEPTAHLRGDGYAVLPLADDAGDARGRRSPRSTSWPGTGATINIFMLGEDPGLARFVDAIARRSGGRVFTPDIGRLGEYVVADYLRARKGRRRAAAQPLVQHGAQRGGERVGVAVLAVLATEETGMVARERGASSPSCAATAARCAPQLLAGLGSPGDDDAGATGPDRLDIGDLAHAGPVVLAQQRVRAVTVVLGGHPEVRRVRRRLVEVVGGELAVVHHERDELRHRRPVARRW